MRRAGWIYPRRFRRSAPQGHGKTRYRAVRSGRCHGSKDAPACGSDPGVVVQKFLLLHRESVKNFGFGKLAETQFLEGLRDVGTLVLARLDTAGLYKIIGVLVPAAVGEIVPEHGSGGLRLADDTDRHIGLGQPGQRFLDMPGGLILGDHGLEAVDGGSVVALV